MRRLDLAVFALLLLVAIGVVHTQHRARRLFVDLQREHTLGEQLSADLRRLQSDQATLAAANRVEHAAGGLHMHQPDPARTVAITAMPVMADQEVPVDPLAADGLPLKLARDGLAELRR
jgi:cell division protein FtsL